MLTIAKDRILEINPAGRSSPVRPGGQPGNLRRLQVRPVHEARRRPDAENIEFGSTLSKDGHADRSFDYLLANPPYGKEWKIDQEAVEAEARAGPRRSIRRWPAADQRRPAALPPAHARPDEATRGRRRPRRHHHERLAAVHRRRRLAVRARSAAGSWRTTGSRPSSPCPSSSSTTPASPPTSGCSPTTSRRSRKGKVQLIDATGFWSPMRKSLGEQAPRNHRRAYRPVSPRSSNGSRRARTPKSSLPPILAIARSRSSARCGSTSRPVQNVSSGSRPKRRSPTWPRARRNRARKHEPKSQRESSSNRRSSRPMKVLTRTNSTRTGPSSWPCSARPEPA